VDAAVSTGSSLPWATTRASLAFPALPELLDGELGGGIGVLDVVEIV
jgi:hypothetical protein